MPGSEASRVDWDRLLDPDEVVAFTRALIQAPSENPPGDTREIAAVVHRKCEELGLAPRTVGPDEIHANVVARLEGSAPGRTLMFNGHIDTVPVGDRTLWKYDPFGGAVDQGRLYGRGATDMLSGVAAMTVATGLVRAAGIDIAGQVLLTAVADEETGGALGTGYLMAQGLTADAAICTEPSELDLTLAHKGAYWIRVTTRGVAAHASMPELGTNAVQKMAKLIASIDGLRLSHTPHPLLSSPVVSPGTMIEGGIKENVVPDRCSATFDIRTVPGQDRSRLRQEIRAFLDELAEEDPGFRAEIEELLWADAAAIEEHEPIVRTAAAAIERVTGRVPAIEGSPGGADARLIAAAGIPTIPMLGPGSVDLAHKPDEYVEVGALVTATKVYAEIICDFLALDGAR